MSNGKGSGSGKDIGHDDTVCAPARQTQAGVGRAQLEGPSVALKRQELAQHHSDGSLMAGTMIGGKYQITRMIGRGAMGEVHEALHIELDKKMAIKVLKGNLGNDTNGRDLQRRFELEARMVAKIDHENVVQVTDFGTTEDGRRYLVMEYLEGSRTLTSVIREGGGIALGDAINIMRQMCRGLSAVHAKGITHRDIKPDNVLLVEWSGRKDHVKMLDFGIAKSEDIKLTQQGQTVGTPQYMSPEQVRGTDIDHRTDVYAAGIVFYEMLCGSPPFTGENTEQVLAQLLFVEPKPPSQARPDLAIPPEADQVILKAIQKDKEKRFNSMEELAMALMTIGMTWPAQREAPGAQASQELAAVEPVHEEGAAPAPEEGPALTIEDAIAQIPARTPFYKRRPVMAAIGGIALAAAIGAGFLAYGISRNNTSTRGTAAPVPATAPASVPDAATARPTMPDAAAVRTKVPDAQAAAEEGQVKNQETELGLTLERTRNGKVKKKKKDARKELPVPDYLKPKK